MTFTVRAAQEMRSRVESLTGGVAPSRMGTFHALCHALLRRQGHRVAVGRNFRLLTPHESRHILHDSLVSTSADQRRRLAAAISAVKNGLDVQPVAKNFGLQPEGFQPPMRRIKLVYRRCTRWTWTIYSMKQ